MLARRARAGGKGWSMRIQDIGPAILKRGWIIIALVLVSTLAAAVVAQVQSPVYKVEIAVSATAPINRTTGLPDALTQSAYIALVPSIANFAESIGVAERVSERLAPQGTEIAPERLLKKASAVAEANSTSVRITFTDSSPTRVEEIANAWGDVLAAKTNLNSDLFDQDFKNLLLNGNIVVTNRATAPEKPTQPKTFAYIGLGFFAGLILGLVLSILIEYFNPHFRNPREVEETLGLPVMGILPREKGSRPAASLPAFSEGSRAWEAYAELRSGLIMPPETAPKTILVASAIPFEAETDVAGSMATSMANSGRKVLLVDCDLRGRALSALMGAKGRPGLSDALEGGGGLQGSAGKSGIAGLHFLPAGSRRENSTDLLSTPSFARKVGELARLYDVVLLYGPPLALSVDAAVVAAQAEASVAVIDAERCTRKAAQEALFNFDRVGITPSGVILANVKIKSARRPRPPRREAGAAEAAGPVAAAEAAEKEAGLPPSAAGDAGEVEQEVQQVRESVAEDFRRMGEAGSPIPAKWLRALNSDQAEVRDSAEEAIGIYYRTFLRRYRISGKSEEGITASIIRMMRREGEFADMDEEGLQAHLRQLLTEAGARFSTPTSAGGGAHGGGVDAEHIAASGSGEEKPPALAAENGGGAGGGSAPPREDEDAEGEDWE